MTRQLTRAERIAAFVECGALSSRGVCAKYADHKGDHANANNTARWSDECDHGDGQTYEEHGVRFLVCACGRRTRA